MRNIVVTLALALASSSAFADKAVTSTEILTHEQVKATVDTHIGDVKGCMKSAGGPAKGKLVIRFGVLPSGHTLDPAVREPTVNGALDKCVAAAARAWVFPTRGASAPTQGVDYPFVFSAPAQTAVAQGTPQARRYRQDHQHHFAQGRRLPRRGAPQEVGRGRRGVDRDPRRRRRQGGQRQAAELDHQLRPARRVHRQAGADAANFQASTAMPAWSSNIRSSSRPSRPPRSEV